MRGNGNEGSKGMWSKRIEKRGQHEKRACKFFYKFGPECTYVENVLVILATCWSNVNWRSTVTFRLFTADDAATDEGIGLCH